MRDLGRVSQMPFEDRTDDFGFVRFERKCQNGRVWGWGDYGEGLVEVGFECFEEVFDYLEVAVLDRDMEGRSSK